MSNNMFAILENIFTKLLAVKSEHTKNLAENLAVINDNGFHRIIFGLKTNMSGFFIKSFDRCGIINQGNDSIAVIGCLAAFNKNLIAAVNSDVNNGIAL